MRIMTNDGRVLGGTALQVAQGLASLGLGGVLSPKGYIEEVLARMESMGLPLVGVAGDSEEQLAVSFVDACLKRGLLGKL
jgi:hypothetical protein